MSTPSTQLDADELFHLALKATQENQTERAIEFLKRAVGLAPDNGKIHYLLGALHAEIGMYDRAAIEMAHAVELEPELHAARFQLGLLLLTSGQVEPAKTAWQSLDQLGEQNFFYLFKTGMLALAEDDFENAIRCIELGIENNAINLPLNNDMQRVLEKAKSTLESMQTETTTNKSPEAKTEENSPKSGRHILLSAYQRGDDDKKTH